ncbi:unnamed protein product [Parnassius apollo]|uniref:(apollo) hypothetical protein n=1 Tax=Parnassius apollo TaxID=110799 RepID=A0A8S3Y7G5_PARAO|nr:unnamed protein product [Parnassius apollo]
MDEEDQAFILQGMEACVSEFIIEPLGATDSTPDPDSTPGPSSSPDSPLSGAALDFKLKTNTYQPYLFSETGYYDFDLQEMTAFIGMNYVMGDHVLPTLRNYWSTEPDMGVPYLATVMPLSKFEEIRNLHSCNNSEQPPPITPYFDRAYKIRGVMNHFNSSFQSAMNNTITQSIDEHMVKFKGHNVMKQYMQNKPVKRGFKMWCRADSKTGYLFHFDLYTGKKRSGPEIGLGETVVLTNFMSPVLTSRNVNK